MREVELRELVRAAIARNRAPAETPVTAVARPATRDISHHRFQLPETDGPCLIEPAVPCNHCGFCQSYGN